MSTISARGNERAEPFNKLHDVNVKNLPKGFEAAISYGGLGNVILPI